MPKVEERIAQLEQEIAKQKEELSRLRGEPHKSVSEEPWRKIDYTDGMCMPPSAVRAMVDVVGDGLARQIAGDARRKSELKPAIAEHRPKGTGWVEASPLKPPSGVDLCDRMMDIQDQIDRAALIDATIRSKLR
jgi:hypothetical protein